MMSIATPERGARSSVAIPASTVIIARDSAQGLQILAIERAKGMGFAGGAVAFPGGKVDASDSAEGDCFEGFGGLDAVDATARVAAAREAFEESGILLSGGAAVSAELRAELRPASDRHEIGFGELLQRVGHRLDAARLVPFARWLPPEGLHKRFDTHFYVAALPDGEEMAADGHEAVHARWATPAELLADADAGRISLLFPTRCNVARLGQFGTVAKLLADETPPPFIQPTISPDGWLSIPADVGYPYVRERLETVRRQ
ncbi:NUDIX hydrolase [Sandaracinobacteroides hominis]|uniref:NUDIX hydrolase n=1 Tax=Sandaracinobacteroides hominis TaxID=2780086 RepID=UPI0018F39868|nr:NUDIX domain-containing protein [Sandaracinobacteroides hominis]